MTSLEACNVLGPLFFLAGIESWNGPSQKALAERIAPRDVRDLTVREVLALMNEVPA